MRRWLQVRHRAASESGTHRQGRQSGAPAGRQPHGCEAAAAAGRPTCRKPQTAHRRRAVALDHRPCDDMHLHLLAMETITTVPYPYQPVGLSRGKVEVFLSGSVPTEKRMGNCRRAVRVPCTSSGFRQLPRNRRENTLGLHTIALLRPAGSAPSRCQSHGSRVYMYSILT